MTGTTAPAPPLLTQHQALGAQFTDFAGYCSELAEHRAVRSTAGLFDLSHMGEIVVDGPDAGALLDYALAGEPSKVVPGRAKYSLLCDAGGGVLDDLVVYRLSDDRFVVVANAANVAVVSREFNSRAAGFDAQVRDVSAQTALLAVQGPLAQDIVSALAPAGQKDLVESMKYYAAASAVVAGLEVMLARTGYTGEDGFEMYVPNRDAPALWQALLDATIDRGGAAAGLACRDTLRLEAGMALYGHELTLDINPYEAGLGRVVKLSKDFVGRDALQRIADQAPSRGLVSLVGNGRRAARAGYPVHDANGAQVGTVTSGALSPTLGYPIALGYVDAAHLEPGTELSVDIRGKKELFTVTSPPFYRRP
jgi:aminomethyltransferase